MTFPLTWHSPLFFEVPDGRRAGPDDHGNFDQAKGMFASVCTTMKQLEGLMSSRAGAQVAAADADAAAKAPSGVAPAPPPSVGGALPPPPP